VSSSKLILIRHAHRDIQSRELDNGLSEKGRSQAEASAKILHKLFSAYSPRIISSPKQRCVETAYAIAKQYETSVQIDESLIEKGPSEESRNFRVRIQKWIREFELMEAPLLIACSHGDWIPTAFKFILEEEIQLRKSAWIVLDFEDGIWQLSGLVQDPLNKII